MSRQNIGLIIGYVREVAIELNPQEAALDQLKVALNSRHKPGIQEWLEVVAAFTDGLDLSRIKQDHFLQLGTGGMSWVEGFGIFVSPAHEDNLRGQLGQIGMRIVGIPDNAGGVPAHSDLCK